MEVRTVISDRAKRRGGFRQPRVGLLARESVRRLPLPFSARTRQLLRHWRPLRRGCSREPCNREAQGRRQRRRCLPRSTKRSFRNEHVPSSNQFILGENFSGKQETERSSFPRGRRNQHARARALPRFLNS